MTFINYFCVKKYMSGNSVKTDNQAIEIQVVFQKSRENEASQNALLIWYMPARLHGTRAKAGYNLEALKNLTIRSGMAA